MVSVDLSIPRVPGVLHVEQAEGGLAAWSVEIRGMNPELVGKRVRLSSRSVENVLYVGAAYCAIAAQRDAADLGYTQFQGTGSLTSA